MSAELLSLIAGAILSLAFAYIPGLKTLFNKQQGTTKRLVLAIALALAAAGAYGANCWQPDTFITGIECSQAGAVDLLGLYILSLMANQSTYSIAVRS